MEDEGIPDERPWRRREYSSAYSTLGVGALVVLVVGVAIWFLEFRGDSGETLDNGDYGIVALPENLNPTGKKPVAEVGRAAPNFILPGLDGADSTLADYRGKPVLINFWASWCGPCRGEAPELQALADEGNLVVLGINQQETKADAAKFREEFVLTFPLVLDTSGEVAEAYRVPGLPISVLVDADGVIVNMYLKSKTIGEDVRADLAAMK